LDLPAAAGAHEAPKLLLMGRVPDHVGEHHGDEPTIEPLNHRSSLGPFGDGNIGTR